MSLQQMITPVNRIINLLLLIKILMKIHVTKIKIMTKPNKQTNK